MYYCHVTDYLTSITYGKFFQKDQNTHSWWNLLRQRCQRWGRRQRDVGATSASGTMRAQRRCRQCMDLLALRLQHQQRAQGALRSRWTRAGSASGSSSALRSTFLWFLSVKGFRRAPICGCSRRVSPGRVVVRRVPYLLFLTVLPIGPGDLWRGDRIHRGGREKIARFACSTQAPSRGKAGATRSWQHCMRRGWWPPAPHTHKPQRCGCRWHLPGAHIRRSAAAVTLHSLTCTPNCNRMCACDGCMRVGIEIRWAHTSLCCSGLCDNDNKQRIEVPMAKTLVDWHVLCAWLQDQKWAMYWRCGITWHAKLCATSGICERGKKWRASTGVCKISTRL